MYAVAVELGRAGYMLAQGEGIEKVQKSFCKAVVLSVYVNFKISCYMMLCDQWSKFSAAFLRRGCREVWGSIHDNN